jgi:hypothetical protein
MFNEPFPLINRIIPRVTKINRGYETDCWEPHVHCGSGDGYARVGITINGKVESISIHRYVFWYYFKRNDITWEDFDKKKKLCVCHKCDNMGCCNPEHLFAGSQKDNVYDALNKKRHVIVKVKGEQHGNHKLTEQEVLEIYNTIGSDKEIAKKYSIHYMNVHHIKKGETWSWLTSRR